jgi:HD-GYP domain-containing protein (c-di-GMP phosphodiesterase class II)
MLNYKKDLEKAARQMILIHRVDTLIKLILRSIIKNVKVKHAGFLLYDKERNEYVAKTSKGEGGLRVPCGFTKVKKDNSLIRYFTDENLRVLGRDFLLLNKVDSFLNSQKGKKNKELKTFFEKVKFQFSLYNAVACIPGFFRNELICILILGQKLDRKQFSKEELGFLSVLSSDVVMAIQNAWFFQDLNTQLQINKKLFLQTVEALATAIDAKDKYTLGHTERVSHYSLVVAEEMKNMKRDIFKDWDKFIQNLRIASLLHDIGKIGVSEEILNKKTSLTVRERREIQKHPLVGFLILKQVDEFQEPMGGVKHHHERYDGGGYPDGIRGRKIPLIAQIISVVDTFDAMTTDRPYRKGLSDEEAAKVIKENRGKQFSPIIVDAFLRAYKQGKINFHKK